MGMPRKPAVETMPDGRVYYVDNRNDRWRVHDLAYGPPVAAPFKRKRLPLGDRLATDRHFVSEAGEQRAYRFEPTEAREVSVEALRAQLEKAGYPAKGRFDGEKHYTPGGRAGNPPR